MKSFKQETIIGGVSIITLLVLYFGVNYLKGINLFRPTNYYYVALDNIGELKAQNAVYVDGYKVGQVHELQYNYDVVGGKLLAVLDVDKKLKIPTGSRAELKVSLLGTASIELHFNKYVSTYYQKGDTLEGYSATGLMSKMSDEMLPSVGQMLPRVDTILGSLQQVLTDPAFPQAIQHIESMAANLDNSTKVLNKMMQKEVPSMISNLNELSKSLKEVSKKVNAMDLSSTYATLDNALRNIDSLTASLNSNKGSVGMLLNDQQLYKNLSNLTADLDSLILDLKANPKRYVQFSMFGKKEKEK